MGDKLVERLRAISLDDRQWGQELDIREAADALETQAARITALEDEILRLVDALGYAHASGFEWPDDPLPFGSIAHDLFIYRGNDPERIAARAALQGESDDATPKWLPH